MRSVIKGLFSLTLLLGLGFAPSTFVWAQEQDVEDLSIESLLDVPVSAAAKYEQTTREAPASVSVITAEDIARYGYATLSDALGSVPGFYGSYDRNYAYVGVRGFSRPSDYNNRLLILVNGYSANEYSTGGALTGTGLALDLDAVERIEVVRGPGSALYGTSAMFAVVNVITKDAKAQDGLRASATAGSFGYREGAVSFGKTFASDLHVTFSGLLGDVRGQDLYFEDEDDPEAGSGLAEGTDGDQYYGFTGTAAYKGFTLMAQRTSREKGIPNGAWDTFLNSGAWTRDSRTFAGLRYEQPFGVGISLSLRAHVDEYTYDGYYPYLYEGEAIDGFDDSATRRVGGDLQFQWDTGPGNRLVLGSEVRHHFQNRYTYWDEYETYVDFDVPSSSFSLYVQDEYQVLRNLAVTVGLRHDQYTDVGGATSPRLAFVYMPFQYSTLKLLYGEAFRTPSAYELYYDDPVGEFKRSASLKPERIRTSELVWEQAFSRSLSGSVSLYRYSMRDLIDTVTDPADSLVQFQNVAQATARGLEASLQARFTPALQGYFSYTLQHAREAGEQETLSNSPTHLAKGGLAFPLPGPWTAATELRYEGRRRTVNETLTDPFVLANLSVHTQRFFDRLQLSGHVRNLFNTSYALPGGYEHRQDAIAQDGRSFALKILYRF